MCDNYTMVKESIKGERKAEYKSGDKVKIVDVWPSSCHPDGKMDKWLGKVMTIRLACHPCYYMEEDMGDEGRPWGWTWYEPLIERLANKDIQIKYS